MTCIVKHFATPAQLCRFGAGLQFYFVGADGSTEAGPYLPSVSDLARTYPADAATIEKIKRMFRKALGQPAAPKAIPAIIELYAGVNPMTGKPVLIDYLRKEELLRVSTYYPDTPTSTSKPYIFTLNESNQVTHRVW